MTESQRQTLVYLECEAREHEAKAAEHLQRADRLDAEQKTTLAAYDRKSARVHGDIARITREEMEQLKTLIAKET